MNYLLDTNVVSEWVKPRPDAGVVAWLAGADEDRLHISVVTLAELRHGIERLPGGARRGKLDDWLRHDLPLRFEDRIVPIDQSIADAWGVLMARCAAAGRSLGVMDGFIAATAEARALTLVTRNAADFEGATPNVVNPWRRG
ncbi:MAG: type II toxin-antitoxin system VapC family toxin [Alphaproteobacteria bacterium]